MTSLDAALLDMKRLDQLSRGDTLAHRLDPRAKVLVTLVFLGCVVSFGRYELSALIPFFLFPAVVIGQGNLPVGYIARKVALAAPFILLIGLGNPLFDRTSMLPFGGFEITAGWISCFSLLLRGMLTMSAALVLVAVTGFPALCRALERLGLPKAFAMQLAFLYRYLFVLVEDGTRAARAREIRAFGKRGETLSSYGSLLGHLLLRSWQRADRVHMAMLARSFSGGFGSCDERPFNPVDLLFVAGWSALLVTMRLLNVPQIIGSAVTGLLP